MNESTKFYTTLFLTVLLTIVSFLGGIITYRLITNGQSSYQKENVNGITLNLINLQKTNTVYVTNYVDVTNTVYVTNSTETDISVNFGKISNGLTIKPIPTVISTDINVSTNKQTDADLDKISNELMNLIKEIQTRK